MISTLYQDKWIWIINKPSLVHSVANKNSDSPSIAKEIIEINDSARDYSLKEEDAGLINRLDYETSGIILAAKSRQAWEAFRNLLMGGKIEKRYLIIVEGEIDRSIAVENWLGSRHRGSKKVSVLTKKLARSKRALPAKSLFIPIRYDASLNLTLVEVQAATARRHQIRAHAAYLKHPLSGDRLYGSRTNLPGCATFFLHSWKVAFNHPFTDKKFSFEAPLPKDLLGLSLLKDFTD